MNKVKLFHAKGCGSVAVIIALDALNVPFELLELHWDLAAGGLNKDEPNYQILVNYNPLAQLPTMVIEDGTVITEIAAIFLYLQEFYGNDSPWSTKSLTRSQLASYYRWLSFIPATIYPTITIFDFPERFLEVPESAACPPEAVHGWLKESATSRRGEMLLIMEKFTSSVHRDNDCPYFLNTPSPTFLDIYVSMVAHWSPRPRREWMEANCPTLVNLTKAMLKYPIVNDVFVANNFVQWIA